MGWLIAFVVGYIGGRISSSSSSRPVTASRWTGSVGAAPFTVYRNGASWAWTAPAGSGAEATLIGALRAAVRFILEGGSVQNDAGLGLARDDGHVSAQVVIGPTGAWSFSIDTNTNGVPFSELGRDDFASRGAAILAMFDQLAKYAES